MSCRCRCCGACICCDCRDGRDGRDGVAGISPNIGSNGTWWIGNTDTGIKAEGKDGLNGKDGDTPYIGENDDWWIGDVDTGVKAKAITEFGSFYYFGNKTVNSGELIAFPTTLSKQVVDINSSGDTITLGDAPYYAMNVDTSLTSFNPGSVTIVMLENGVETGISWQASAVGEISKHFIIPNPGKGTEIQFKVTDGSYIELGGTDITATVTFMGINS